MFKIKISVTDEEYDDVFTMEQSVKNFLPWFIADKFLDLSHELNVYENRPSLKEWLTIEDLNLDDLKKWKLQEIEK